MTLLNVWASMVRCQNVKGKHVTSLSQHFIIIQSDQDLCLVTKLMNTIEYMNGQEQIREDPDETVRIHRLILTFTIRLQ